MHKVTALLGAGGEDHERRHDEAATLVETLAEAAADGVDVARYLAVYSKAVFMHPLPTDEHSLEALVRLHHIQREEEKKNPVSCEITEIQTHDLDYLSEGSDTA